jgi:twitching motility protein PilT
MASGQDELLFGRLAVHYKLITANQLEEVHGLHALAGGRRRLTEILVEMGYLNQRQVDQLLVVQRDYLEKRRDQATKLAVAVAAGPPAAPAPPAAGSPPATAPPAASPATPAATAALAEGVVGPAIGPDSGTHLPSITAFAAEAPPLLASRVPAGMAATAVGSAVETKPASAATSRPTAAPAADWASAASGREQIDALLGMALERGASDVHLHSGAPISLRIYGRLQDLEPRPLPPDRAKQMIHEILDDAQRAALAGHGQVDFAYSLPGLARFRANAYRQRRGTDATFRALPSQPPTLAALGLPDSLARLADHHQGMVLITGPSGCGKSSTLAALLAIINETRADHIITVEDPIECLHPSRRAIVNQRQIGPHSTSFARALRAALREDPDVIAIGELRDLETIALAITAAETGHLVLGTLHTNNAIRTINRLLGVFPPNQQAQIRTMLSESLRAVVSQRLVLRADGKGRVAALEVLIVTKAAANLIRENKTFQIRSILQTGATHGMVQLDASLAELVKSRIVSREEALLHAEDPAKIPA